MTFAGVVLAGGSATRLGGANKPTLHVGASQLLDLALDALAAANTRIAVGSPVATTRSPRWVREEPTGGGPVSAIAAALPLISDDVVVVLAADLPFVSANAITALLAALMDNEAVLAIDQSGRDQPLLAAYRTSTLRRACPEPSDGVSMRVLVREVEAIGPIQRLDLGGNPPVTIDCDTAADLERARELAQRSSRTNRPR